MLTMEAVRALVIAGYDFIFPIIPREELREDEEPMMQIDIDEAETKTRKKSRRKKEDNERDLVTYAILDALNELYRRLGYKKGKNASMCSYRRLNGQVNCVWYD